MSDVAHDDSTKYHDVMAFAIKSRIFGPEEKYPYEANEDRAVDGLVNAPPSWTVNPAARIQDRIPFVIKAGTDAFQKDSTEPFVPFTGIDNANVGIVYDAGTKLFECIKGCQNLLTFGSVLDPAKKPQKPKENPVWLPYPGNIMIPACMFGFDPNKVGNIVIKKFNGRTVQCGFEAVPREVGDLAWYDGGVKANVLEELRRGNPDAISTDKKINDCETGLFRSNDQVATYYGALGVPLIVGKALGDALQVASIMPQFWDASGARIPNPAYPVGPQLTPGGKSVPNPITHVMLSTGDRLNHARAFMLGVPSAYLRPAPKGETTQACDYIPGEQAVADPTEVYNDFRSRVYDLVSSVYLAYDNLLKSLKSSIAGSTGATFNTEYSKFQGTPFVTTEPQKQAALDYIQKSIRLVQLIQVVVVHYYLVRAEWYRNNDYSETLLENIRGDFKRLNSILPNLTPACSSMLSRGAGNCVQSVVIAKSPNGNLLNLSDLEVVAEGEFIKASSEEYFKDPENTQYSGKISLAEVRKLLENYKGTRKNRNFEVLLESDVDVVLQRPNSDNAGLEGVFALKFAEAFTNIRANRPFASPAEFIKTITIGGGDPRYGESVMMGAGDPELGEEVMMGAGNPKRFRSEETEEETEDVFPAYVFPRPKTREQLSGTPQTELEAYVATQKPLLENPSNTLIAFLEYAKRFSGTMDPCVFAFWTLVRAWTTRVDSNGASTIDETLIADLLLEFDIDVTEPADNRFYLLFKTGEPVSAASHLVNAFSSYVNAQNAKTEGIRDIFETLGKHFERSMRARSGGAETMTMTETAPTQVTLRLTAPSEILYLDNEISAMYEAQEKAFLDLMEPRQVLGSTQPPPETPEQLRERRIAALTKPRVGGARFLKSPYSEFTDEEWTHHVDELVRKNHSYRTPEFRVHPAYPDEEE